MTKEHKEIEKLSPNARVVYEAFSMPFPVTDRDFVYLLTFRFLILRVFIDLVESIKTK